MLMYNNCVVHVDLHYGIETVIQDDALQSRVQNYEDLLILTKFFTRTIVLDELGLTASFS